MPNASYVQTICMCIARVYSKEELPKIRRGLQLLLGVQSKVIMAVSGPVDLLLVVVGFRNFDETMHLGGMLGRKRRCQLELVKMRK